MKDVVVAVLRGGPSQEYDVSMQTGAEVLSSLRSTYTNTKDIIITREGQWLTEGFVKDPMQALIGVDVVFIALHGTYGEDGTVQRMLDRLSIRYTGSTAFASAIAMNKEATKNHLKANTNLSFPQHIRVQKQRITDPLQYALSIGELFGPQYIIKPTSGGSSLDTMYAANVHELGVALTKLFHVQEDLLVEEFINGKEATVGIIENYRDQAVYDLPSIEIIPPGDTQFFTDTVKYNGQTQEICPGGFSKVEKDLMATIAKEVHVSLGLRHYSRSDFIVSNDSVYFLEVNTLPGLTKGSLFPKSIEAVGGSFDEFVHHLITQAYTSTV